ncbi:ATP-binding protein [Embleya sp. NBC_00896]|uniref:ATP-binding protein n=1 Tax=Embleya sp. NBC_00896 TaxID=2975961 RepID=UPI0038703B91|nr:AAA family ATPase [Embleya sp. NBC_00896]
MPLVEREFLQRGLRDQIEAVRDTGEGRVAVVSGGAGMGKSAVLEWVRRTAEDEGFSALQVVGYELDKVRVYGLVKRLFRDLYHLDDEGRKERLGEWYGILGPIFGMSRRQPEESPDTDDVLHALDAVVHGYLLERGPLVVIVDDAHWADPSSMHWLAQFALEVREFPILIVVSYRPGEYDEELVAPLRALDTVAESRFASLSGLSVEGTGTVIRRRFPDERVDAEFVERCHRYSGGQPQTLRELLRFVEQSGIEPTAAALPEHGDAMERNATRAYHEGHFKERFARLKPDARKLALAVAILTPHVTIERAASLARLSRRATVDAAEYLWKQEILTEEPSNLGFTHPLVRNAVYQHCIEPNARCKLHAKAARLLREDGYSAQTAATHVVHMVGITDRWAVDVAVDAARECLASGVPEAGVTYLRHAFAELAPPDMRARIQYNIGRAYFVNNPPKSIEPLTKALEDCEPDRDLRTNIVVELARSLCFSGRLHAGIELLDTEIRLTPPGPIRQRLYADLFMWAAFWEDDTSFASRAHDLQRLTVRLNTEGITSRTNYSLFALVAWYGVLTGRRLQTTTKFARAALGPEGPNKERPGFSWVEDGWGFEIPMVLTLTFIYCDLFKEARELLERGMAELKANGRQRAHLSYGHAFRAMLLYRMGRLKEAREQAEIGLEMALELGPETPSQWYAAGVLIQTLIAQGDLEEAELQAQRIGFDDPERPRGGARVLPVPEIVLAELRIAQGRHAEVITPLTELGERLRARGMDNPAWCPWGLLLAEALNAEGPQHDKEQARKVAKAAVARADTFYAPVAAGQAKRVAGEVEDNVNAQQALWDAAVALEGVGANYEYAKALLAYGDRLRKDGHKPDAIGELERARDTAMACGAIPLQTRAAEMVDALMGITAAAPLDHGHAESDAWVDEYSGGYSPFGIPHRDEPRHDAESDRAETWPFREVPARRPDME